MAVFKSGLNANILFGLFAIFESLENFTEFQPNSHVLQQSGDSTLKMFPSALKQAPSLTVEITQFSIANPENRNR